MPATTTLGRLVTPKFPVTVTFETKLPIKSRSSNLSLTCMEVGVITADCQKVVALIATPAKDQCLWFVIPVYPNTELGQAILAIKPDFMDLEPLKDKVRSAIIKAHSAKE